MYTEAISEQNINIQQNGIGAKKITTRNDHFASINELQLNVDQKNKEDIGQITRILGDILNYPNSNQAQIHSKAMKLGNFDLQKTANNQTILETSSSMMTEKEHPKFCPCCGFIIQDQPIKICTSFDVIKNMGVSTYLYFSTYKNLAILLVIMMIIYGAFALATNILASTAVTSSGISISTVDYISISLSSKQTNDTSRNRLYYYIQCWLGVVFTLIWSLVLIYIKYSQVKQMSEYDNDTISCSDYSISIEGIPIDVTKQELQKQLTSYYQVLKQTTNIPVKWQKPLNIAKINIGKPFYLNQSSLKNQELQNNQKQITDNRQQIVKWIYQRKQHPNFSITKQQRQKLYTNIKKTQQTKQLIYQEMLIKIKNSLKEQSNDQLTTIFVTFDTNFPKSLISYYNQETIISKVKSFCGKDQTKFIFQREGKYYHLQIRRAPEPQDIIWTNIGQNNCATYGRKFFTFSLTVILLGVCFAIVFGLTKAQQNNNNNRYISIAISLTISVVNILLGQLIRYLTLFEKDYTETNHQASLAIKSILAQMVNSILIPVISAYYIIQNVYQTSGLVDNIFIMSITNSLIPPILLLLDPYNIYLKILRHIKSSPNSKLTQTQKEHNALHEGMAFQVGYQYLYMVNLFMFVCFFVSLQPIVILIALVGYFLMYWVQKYCLFNRYKRPIPGTNYVNQAVYQIIFMGPFIYSLGSLTWANFADNGIPREALLPNLIALGLSTILCALPMNTIIIGCFFQDNSEKPSDFEKNRIFMPSQYDRLNPSTQEEGLLDYNRCLQRQKLQIKKLSKEDQNDIAKKLMNNAQRANQTQVSNPMMGGFPFFQNNFNIMPQLMQPMQPMQPLNSYFGLMPNQATFTMPSMPYIPMQQPLTQMIPQGSTMYHVQPPLNMSQTLINSTSIPVNPAAYGNGHQINMNGFNHSNPHNVNNFSPYTQGANFQNLIGGNRPF